MTEEHAAFNKLQTTLSNCYQDSVSTEDKI